MRIADYYDLENLRSTSEELVLERVGRLLEDRSDICKCEQCVLDLIAYVLNHVSPFYGTSLLGSLDSKQEKVKLIRGEIEAAMREGLKRVVQHPNHD